MFHYKLHWPNIKQNLTILVSDIMARKTKAQAQQTYHQLLDSAAELFSQQGVNHTTLNDIARHAGMTRGAIYWHFQNKDDVIRALWERDAAPALVAYLHQLNNLPADNPAHTFQVTLKALIAQICSQRKVGQAVRIVLNSAEFTPQETELQRYLKTKSRELHSAIVNALMQLEHAQLLNPNYPARLMAGALWSYLHGLVDTNVHTDIQQVDLQQDSDRLIELFLHSLFNERAQAANTTYLRPLQQAK